MLFLLATALAVSSAAPQNCTFTAPPELTQGDPTSRSMAVGADTLFVGYPFIRNAAGQENRGRVKVLALASDGEITPTGWIEHPPTSTAHRFFGRAIAAENDRMVVTCPDDEQLPGIRGMAYAYARDASGQWNYEDRVSSPWGTYGTRFGNSAAMCGDWLFIGELETVAQASTRGRVHVYRRSGGTWSQTQVITGETSHFGNSLDADGARLLVGASTGSIANSDGGAFVFEESGGVWSQTASLADLGGGGSDHYFGQDVALEGNVAVVSASGYRTGQGSRGAVGVFALGVGGSWSLVGELRPIPGTGGSSTDAFGRFVDLDGGKIVVGRAATGVSASAIRYGLEVFGTVCGNWQRARVWGAPDASLPLASPTQDVRLVGSRVIAAYPTLLVSRELNCTLGVAECTPNMQNATRVTSLLRALGSTVVADDDLRLRAEGLPGGSAGLMLLSATAAMTPFQNCTAELCLGGTIARGSATPLVANAQGRVVYPLDLQGLPPILGGGSVQSGQTWHFQYWYRNPSVNKPAGLSNGVSILFE